MPVEALKNEMNHLLQLEKKKRSVDPSLNLPSDDKEDVDKFFVGVINDFVDNNE